MTQSYSGKFLVSLPGMDDPTFSESVICLCEHDAQGAFGLIVNQPLGEITEADVFAELGLPTERGAHRPVFYGGPVREEGLFILHGDPMGWEGCLEVAPGVGVSYAHDIVTAIAEGKGPTEYLMLLGCAGWGAGQLEEELLHHLWWVHDLDPNLMFHAAPRVRWKSVFRQMGISPDVFSQSGGNA